MFFYLSTSNVDTKSTNFTSSVPVYKIEYLQLFILLQNFVYK